MDRVEGQCLITDRPGQIHVGKRNHDSFISAALIYYSEGPTMKLHIRGERREKIFKALFLRDFLESL